MIGALILRDGRRGFTGAAWLPIAFFLLIAALIPFAIGPDAQVLSRVVLRPAPGHTVHVVRRSITFAPSAGMPVVLESRAA